MASDRRPREFWERLVAEAERTTTAATAGRHGVSLHTLKWWRWKLGQRPVRRGAARLLPVVLRAAEPATAEIAQPPIGIELQGGVSVRVPVGTDAGYVAALVAAIRAKC